MFSSELHFTDGLTHFHLVHSLNTISSIHSETVFESLDAGYLEKCGTNMKAPLHGIDMPTPVSLYVLSSVREPTHD